MSVTPLPAPPTSAQDLVDVTVAQWQAVLAAEPSVAATWLLAAARLGHAEAQAVLGQWLLDGRGVARDPEAALHWFLGAAHNGHPMGMNMAGRCHEQGWGTAEDAGKAVHWYRLAVQRDLTEARYNLANMLATGRGVVRDDAQAYGLYQAAAGRGYVKAYAKIGRYFEDGVVVARDPEAAFDWYRRGAEGGDFRGQFCYAGMLAMRGQREAALRWLGKVPETATVGYLRQAGELLNGSSDPDFSAVGATMLARAG